MPPSAHPGPARFSPISSWRRCCGWSTVSAILTANSILFALFQLRLDKAMTAMSPTASLLVGYALTALAFGLIGVLGSGWGLLAATVVWSAAEW